MMKSLTGAIAAIALNAALVTCAAAQVVVVPSGSRQDVAANVASSATSAATLTLTPQAGQYVYLSEVHITNCATGTVTPAAVTTVTSTNLGGAAWTVGSGATIGLCQPESLDTFGGAPFKAAATGAVTIVLPTFAANQVVRVSAYWYSAP